MATIITSADILANDIRKQVDIQPTYLDNADSYYLQLLYDYGVDAPETMPPTELAPIVKEVLINYICMSVCRDLMGYNYRQVADGVSEDPYQSKYERWKKDLQDTLMRINYDVLTLRKVSKGVNSGQIFRG